MDLQLLLIATIAALMAGFWGLVYNRQELLKVIKEKETTLDAHTRAIAKSQEETNRYLIECQELDANLRKTLADLELEREKNQVVISQKKSSETRLGQITEHLVPFLEGCPYNPKDLHFLGQPIDFISFDFDAGEITFIEVKSGNSKPSKRQKLIKHMIAAGNIKYDEIRVDQKGVRNKKGQP